MRNAVLYVHGKGGSADEAARYRDLCPDCHVSGVPYRGVTPWETKGEIRAAYDDLLDRFGRVSVIANSIGAYFTMNALQETRVERALFISPIVDMERLITDMMSRAGVTEAELQARGNVDTESGQLSWEYLQYVRAHALRWTAPTWILYGEHDDLTPRDVIESFADRRRAALTVMEGGEHLFHTEAQEAFLGDWVRRCMA
ncbi:MAG: alpha/beta hydrolase [Oscillibacter sp.]|nr:alpha/beta hydrolase [Oscillibacter sp.]